MAVRSTTLVVTSESILAQPYLDTTRYNPLAVVVILADPRNRGHHRATFEVFPDGGDRWTCETPAGSTDLDTFEGVVAAIRMASTIINKEGPS